MRSVETEKYDYIDAIRGFAVLAVVLVHSTQWVRPASGLLSRIAAEGSRGVQLFFMASALTLFLSMGSRTGEEERPVLGFFIRRFFRIAPAFYLALIVYTAYDGLSPRHWAPNGISWWYLPATALFLHGWHPETIDSVVPGGWSIAVEMTFYLIAPYLFSTLKSIKSTLAALLGSLVFSRLTAPVIEGLWSPYYPDAQQYLVRKFSYFWFFSQLPVFLLGILLYHVIIKHPRGDKDTSRLLMVSSLFLFTAFLHVTTFENILPKHFLFGVGFFCFSLSLCYSSHGLFINKFTIMVGKLSFSIYLVHFMVLNLAKKAFPGGFPLDGNLGSLAAYASVLALSIGISSLTHAHVELPGIRLGKSIIEKL